VGAKKLWNNFNVIFCIFSDANNANKILAVFGGFLQKGQQ